MARKMESSLYAAHGFFPDHKPHSPSSLKWESLTLATGGDLNGTEQQPRYA